MNEYALPTYGNRYPRGAVACMYVYGTSMLLRQLASQLHCSRVLVIKHLLSLTSEVA